MNGSVAIVGLGLIGGSVARRLSAGGWRVAWVDPGIDRSDVVSRAPGLEQIEPSTLADWPLVVLATPTGAAIELLAELETGRAVVTSVCSVMRPLAETAKRRSIRFVAGHPMAGREVRGWSNSLPDLFEDRPWFRAISGDEDAVARVDEMIAACGATAVPIDPAEHDGYAALASHLPQLLSSALAALIEQSEVPEPFLGPGLRTFLRLAGSPWSMWEPVFEHNSEAVENARAALDDLALRIGAGDGEALFEKANELYRKLQ